MKENKNIYLLTGDLGYAMLDSLRDDHPERFVNCGASEQAMMGMAVGLAQEGMKPFVYSITPFLLSRGHEWIRNYIDHEQAPVRLVGSGRDDDYKHDGFSHFSFDALDTLRQFDIKVYSPTDKSEVPDMVREMVLIDRPSFISLSR
jgi:transketolase